MERDFARSASAIVFATRVSEYGTVTAAPAALRKVLSATISMLPGGQTTSSSVPAAESPSPPIRGAAVPHRDREGSTRR